MKKDIPEISLQRLPVYLNYLRSLSGDDGKYISSGAIAAALGMGEVLVRKDLAYTSGVGRPKVGYVREELIAALEDYLGCNIKKQAVLVGAGELGRALLAYGGFEKYGISIACAFDSDPEKAGSVVAGKPVRPVSELPGLAEEGIKLAIVAVPASAAQSVCMELARDGVRAILNFAPVRLKAPDGVVIRDIDVAANLAVLSNML